MSFNIFENDLSSISTIPKLLVSFEKMDNYILEKEKLIKDLEFMIIKEKKNSLQVYEDYIETENQLQKLQKEEELLNKELQENEEKENSKRDLYTKIMEFSFDNKLRIVENEKPYPSDKYFTVEWTIPLRKEDYPLYSNGYTLFIMFDIESKRIVKMNDSKGKILDKENIDWSMFALGDKRNRNALLLEIYKEYGSY